MRLRNCLGMIWSVSTLVRSRGAASAVRVLKGSMRAFLRVDSSFFYGTTEVVPFQRQRPVFNLGRYFFPNFPIANVDEVAGDGGGCGHFRRDEVRATAAALAAFEVAIAGGSAALAGRKNVGVHAEAHGAAWLAPVESG